MDKQVLGVFSSLGADLMKLDISYTIDFLIASVSWKESPR